MKDELNHENLILTSYFFHKDENIFLLKPKEDKSMNDTYNETSEKIKIIRTLRSNEIKFKEQENGDIKIV